MTVTRTDVEEKARSRRIDAYDDTNARLLRDEGNGTSHLGQTTPRLPHATDLIAWLSLGLGSDVHVRVTGHHARGEGRSGYLVAELISCIRYFLGTQPA